MFLWVHLYDPHAPYNPPKEFLPPGRSPYDGEIAYADSQLARILDALRARQLIDHTIVVVAGDHGEGLGDHGERTHGMLVYDSTLRVPLIIAAPGRAAGTREEPVSLVDLAPTLLRAAGVTPPAEMKGRDLLEVRGAARDDAGARGAASADLYSETEYPRVAGWSPLQALTDGRWMTIRAGASTEVYDLRNDPLQEHDVAASQAAIASAMAARAGAIHASAAAGGARVIAPEAQERLRSLGYVASSAPAAPAADAAEPGLAHRGLERLRGRARRAQRRASRRSRDAAAPLVRESGRAGDPDHLCESAEGRRADRAGARGVSPRRGALADRCDPPPRSRGGGADGGQRDARREGGSAARRGARAPNRRRWRSNRPAPRRTTDSACSRSTQGRPPMPRRRSSGPPPLDSNNAPYWANLGNARRAIGDRAGAEQAYRRALELDARTADAANGLGVLLVEANRSADAAPWFERAIAAAPDLVEARLNLGIALQQSGQTARAADAYRLVLAARGTHPREKDAARKLLAALGAAR